MTRPQQCRERLDEWLEGLQSEPLALDDPRLRIEELSLKSLRNFFVLLLASGSDTPQTPVQALERAGGLEHLDLYRQTLALPLQGSPRQVNAAINLGPPKGELFALQQRLLEQLDDEGHRVLVELAQLF